MLDLANLKQPCRRAGQELRPSPTRLAPLIALSLAPCAAVLSFTNETKRMCSDRGFDSDAHFSSSSDRPKSCVSMYSAREQDVCGLRGWGLGFGACARASCWSLSASLRTNRARLSASRSGRENSGATRFGAGSLGKSSVAHGSVFGSYFQPRSRGIVDLPCLQITGKVIPIAQNVRAYGTAIFLFPLERKRLANQMMLVIFLRWDDAEIRPHPKIVRIRLVALKHVRFLNVIGR